MFLIKAICFREFSKELLDSLLEEEIKCFKNKSQTKKKINYDFGFMILGCDFHLKVLIFQDRV